MFSSRMFSSRSSMFSSRMFSSRSSMFSSRMFSSRSSMFADFHSAWEDFKRFFLPIKTSPTMNGCEKTEEGVHPFKVPLCPQLVIQTKAQRLDFDPEDDGRRFCDSVPSLDSGVSMETLGSSASSVLWMKRNSSLGRLIDFKARVKQRSASPTPSWASESSDWSMGQHPTFNHRTLPLELKGQSSTPDIGITLSDMKFNMTGAAVAQEGEKVDSWLQVCQFDSQSPQSTWPSVLEQDTGPQVALDGHGRDSVHTACRVVKTVEKITRTPLRSWQSIYRRRMRRKAASILTKCIGETREIRRRKVRS